MRDFKLKSLAILNEDMYPTHSLDTAQFVTCLFYGDCNNWRQNVFTLTLV